MKQLGKMMPIFFSIMILININLTAAKSSGGGKSGGRKSSGTRSTGRSSRAGGAQRGARNTQSRGENRTDGAGRGRGRGYGNDYSETSSANWCENNPTSAECLGYQPDITVAPALAIQAIEAND